MADFVTETLKYLIEVEKDERSEAEKRYDAMKDGSAYVRDDEPEDTDKIIEVLTTFVQKHSETPEWFAGYTEGWREGRRALIQEIERQLQEPDE